MTKQTKNESANSKNTMGSMKDPLGKWKIQKGGRACEGFAPQLF